MSPRVYTSSRDRILDAAEGVILSQGLGRLSVDAVLRASGASKGGFFHHFASKDGLLAALLERLTARVAASLESAVARDPVAHGRALRAQIALAFEMPKEERERLRALVLALVEAAKTSTTVAESARASTRQWIERGVAEGVPVGDVLVAQLALDGYWLGESMGTLALTRGQRRALFESLRALTLPRAKRERRPGAARSAKTRTSRSGGGR